MNYPIVTTEALIVTSIIVIIAVTAIPYRIALKGNSPSLTKRLRGLNQDRTESRLLRILLFVITYGGGLLALYVFNGIVRVPPGTVRWWMVLVVAFFALVLFTDGLLG